MLTKEDRYDIASLISILLNSRKVRDTQDARKWLTRLLEEIDRLTTSLAIKDEAIDRLQSVLAERDRENAKLEEEKALLREQVQVLSDSLRRAEMRLDNHKARLIGECG